MIPRRDVRGYQTVQGPTWALDEIAQRAKEGFVPIISQVPAFVAYYGVKVGDEGIVAISIFEDQARAEESTRWAAGVETAAGEGVIRLGISPRTDRDFWPSASKRKVHGEY